MRTWLKEMKKISTALLLLALITVGCDEDDTNNPSTNNSEQGTTNPQKGTESTVLQPQQDTSCDCTLGDNACADKCIYATCKCNANQDRLDCISNCYATIACDIVSVDFGSGSIGSNFNPFDPDFNPFDPDFNPYDPSAFNISIDASIDTQTQLNCMKQELQDSVNKSTNGTGCSDSSNCISGYCNGSGICATMPSEKLDKGSACVSNDECKSNYCDYSGTCAAPQTNKSNGESCMASSECNSGYCNDSGKCDNKQSQTSTPKSNGEDCLNNAECDSGYCNDSGKCDNKQSQTSTPKSNGEDCLNNAECSSGYCNDSGKCDNKQSQSSTSKSNGEDCLDNAECNSGYCNDSGKCDNKQSSYSKENGESCTLSYECKSNHCNSEWKCSPAPESLKANGQNCSKDTECISGLCVNDICQSKLKLGENCLLHNECSSGYCTDDYKCGISSLNGLTCSSNSSCASYGTDLTCDTYLHYCMSKDPCAGVSCGTDEVCYMGLCLSRAIHDGEPCVDGLEEVCGKQVVLRCVGGVYKSEKCSSVCLRFKDGKAECVSASTIPYCSLYFKVKNNTTSGTICTSDNTGYYEMTCEEAVNGWFVARPKGEVTTCPSGTCTLENGQAVCE